MKKLLLAVLALVLVLVVLLLAHPLWIGPVVRTAVSQLAPKFLGVPAKLDGFALNFYTGRVALDGFALDNPPACGNEKFVTVGHLAVGVEPMSLFSRVVVIREIALKDLYVSIMSDAAGKYNFTAVAESCEAQKGTAKTDEKAKPAEPKQKAEDGAQKKVVIDSLLVENTLVQWNRVALPLPSFRLTGIGQGSNGVTFEAAWTEAETKFIGSLGPLAQGLQACLNGGQGALNSSVKAVSDVTKSVGDTQKAVKDLSQALKDGSKASADSAAKSINEAAKSIEGSVKTLKSLFGK